MRLRSHLVMLVMAAVLPLLAFAIVELRQDIVERREILDRGMHHTVRALSRAIDGQVKTSLAVLQTLAGSAFLDSADLQAFHALCARAMEGRRGAYVILFDRSGQALLNSSRPFGAALPNLLLGARPPGSDPRYPELPLGGTDPVMKVLESGGPAVSDLFVSLVTGRPRISLDVPVVRDGRVRYVLELAIDAEEFQQLVSEQHLPADSVLAIVDRKGLAIARSLDPSRRVGRPLAPELARRIAESDQGSGAGHTTEGMSVYHVFTRSQLTGWSTSLSVSNSVALAPLNEAAVLFIGGAAIAILLGLGAALVVGRRISRPISKLAASAEAMARGKRAELDVAAVDELQELHRVLVSAGEAVRQVAEERERSVVNHVLDGIITIDEHGTVESFNPAAERLFGFQAAEVVGQNIKMLMPEPYRAGHDGHIANYLRAGTPRVIGIGREFEGRRKDGSIFPIDLGVSEFRIGSRRYFTGIVRDITARKRAEEDLRSSEERLRMALAAGRMGNWEWNIRTNEITWSSDLEAIHGLAPGGFPGTFEAYKKDIHPEDREKVRRSIARSLEDGDHHVEYRIIRPDGSVRWVEGRGKVFRAESGAPARMIGVCMDITERKRAELALKEADRHKDEFLAMLSHELRNPLAALSSAAHVLKVADPLHEAAITARSVVERQTKHMSRLIGDLLDISRITLGKLVLDRERFDLGEAVARLMNVWRASGRFVRHAVSLDAVPVWVDGDRTRIEQVTANLLDNALKFTPEGKAVKVSVEERGGAALLRVADEGAGLAADAAERMFDLFVQAGRGSKGGLGIGLALVKRLSEMHGGAVSVASAGPGQGAVFTVRLPSVQRPAAQETARLVRAAGGRTVLIVEDNDDARQMLAAALALDGHEVRAACDGETGLALAAQARPDIALIDIQLPGMDGYELARRLRVARDRRRISLVALSGFGSTEDQRRAFDAGFDAHLVKPVSAERLKNIMAELQ